MAIDMNPHDVPANTATSVGSREFCARINENDILDADEDEIDTLEIDVTTGPKGIPTGSAMIAFQLSLLYSPEHFIVVASLPEELLASAEGSSFLDLSEPLPDSDGEFFSAAIDVTLEAAESGPGVLATISLESRADSAVGIYDLMIDDAGHVDIDEPWLPLQHLNAFVAIDTECPSEPPPPVTNATPTPTPAPTPPGPLNTQPPEFFLPFDPTATPLPTPTPTACVCGPSAQGIDGDEPSFLGIGGPGPAAFPESGGPPSDRTDTTALGWLLVGLGVTVLAAAATTRAMKR